MKILYLLLFIGLFFPKLSLGATTVILKRHSPRGLEQSSLQFINTKLIYITNSDFSQTPGPKALLGAFHLDSNSKIMAIEQQLEQIKQNFKKTKVPETEFQIEIYIDGIAIPSSSKEHNTVLKLFTELTANQWIADEGVEADLDAKGKVLLNPLGKSAKAASIEKCLEVAAGIECTIAPYGLILLKREIYEKK